MQRKKGFFVGLIQAGTDNDEKSLSMCAVDLATEQVHLLDGYEKLTHFILEQFDHSQTEIKNKVTLTLPLDLIIARGLMEFNPMQKDLFNFCLKESMGRQKKFRQDFLSSRNVTVAYAQAA